MPDFAANLKSIRVAAGLTQQQLADRLGVWRETVAHWEDGTREPHGMVRVLEIAEALGCEAAALIGGTK